MKFDQSLEDKSRRNLRGVMKIQLPKEDWKNCRPLPPNSYKANPTISKTPTEKSDSLKGLYQDPTWIKVQQYCGNILAAVSDGKSRSPPQVCYHPLQNYLGPRPVNGTPKFRDDN